MNHISGPFSTSNFGSFYSYKYNGKELQETGMYDYGARMLMPDLGRWGVMDAMSEKYARWSPYNYAINNPVMVIDPDGNDAMFASGEAAQFAFKMYVATMSTGTGTSGGNGFTGFDNNRGKDPKPGFLGSIGRFFGNLFGGSKGAGIESYVPGAVISRTAGVLEVGEAVEIGVEVAGILRAGIWALPLMLNGDSSHARGYDIPLTSTTDIPITTTSKPEDSENLYLYRNMRSVNGIPMVGESLDK